MFIYSFGRQPFGTTVDSSQALSGKAKIMADSSQVEISYLEESTFGQVPNSGFTKVKHTGGTFGAVTQTTRSGEVRGDAQRGSAVRTGLEPNVTLNMELQGKVFDDFIKQLMRDTWSTAAAVSNTDIQADNTSSAFTSATVDWTTEDITTGQWVYVQGFDTSGANGWFKVTSISASDLTVTPAPSDDTNSGGNTITVEGSYIRNGSNHNSMAMQLQHLDLSNKFRLIKGARLGQWSLDLSSQSVITGSFELMGIDHTLETSAAGDGTVGAAPSVDPMNAVDHVTGVFLDGTKVSGEVANFTFSANMNPRRKYSINSTTNPSPFDIGLGSLDLTGSLQMYLDDDVWSQLQDYLDFTKFDLAVSVVGTDGNGYVFHFPNVVRTNEPGNVPGPDEDVFANFDFSAEPGSVGSETKTFQVSRRQA